MDPNRVELLRHRSEVPVLQGDTSLCGNDAASRGGGRLCGEATGQGIFWPPMNPGRVSLWPRLSARGISEARLRSHGSHASVNPDAVKHFEIPPNGRMNWRNDRLEAYPTGQTSLTICLNEKRSRTARWRMRLLRGG